MTKADGNLGSPHSARPPAGVLDAVPGRIAPDYPAFAEPARRLAALLDATPAPGAMVVTVIEGDVALTLAVLRAANAEPGAWAGEVDTVVRAVEVIAGRLRTGLLTNNVVGMEPSGPIAAVLAHFDVVIESSVVGLRKPDPAFYELANRYPLAERAEGYLLAKTGGDAPDADALAGDEEPEADAPATPDGRLF